MAGGLLVLEIFRDVPGRLTGGPNGGLKRPARYAELLGPEIDLPRFI